MFKLSTCLTLLLGLSTIGLAHRIITSIEEGNLPENSKDNKNLLTIVFNFVGIRDYSLVNTPFVKIGTGFYYST